MVTAEEIAGVAIFAQLPEPERERVARAAADITLVEREYAASPGDERALFAVLSGRIEAVRIDDGIERIVGERLPGDVFGEVPITLGTVFPVGFRAAEGSRVLRIEPRDYHAVAAAAPDVALEVGEAGRPPDGRPRRPAGPRLDAGAAARDRDRAPLGRDVQRAPALSRPQPDHVHVAPARPPRRGRRVVGRRCPPKVTIRRCASSTARPSSARGRVAWRSCSACRRSRPSPSTTR